MRGCELHATVTFWEARFARGDSAARAIGGRRWDLVQIRSARSSAASSTRWRPAARCANGIWRTLRPPARQHRKSHTRIPP